MQLILEVDKIIKENEVVAFTINKIAWHKKYIDLDKKKKKNDRLTKEENDFINSIEPYRTDKIKKHNFDHRQFIDYLKNTPQHFIEMLVPEIFYFLMSIKEKLDDSTVIILLYSNESFPVYKKHFGQQLESSFMDRLVKELNSFIENSPSEYWRTSKIVTALNYNYSQIQNLWHQLIANPDIQNDYSFVKNIIHNLLDQDSFRPIDLTEKEKSIFHKLKFTSFANSELPINYSYKSEITPTYYFIEHLNRETAKRLVKYNHAFGLSLNDNDIYYKRVLKIFLTLSQTNFKGFASNSIDTYKLPYNYMEAVDAISSTRLDKLIENESGKKYAFIQADDIFLKNKIINHISNRLNCKLYETSSLQVKSLSNHKYLFIENFELLDRNTQKDCWRIFEKEHFNNGFVVFYSQDLTKLKWANSINNEKVFKYTESLFAINISRIIYFILKDRQKLVLDDITRERLIHNWYSMLFMKMKATDNGNELFLLTRIDLGILYEAINKTELEIQFDFNSVRSWYKLQLNYKNKLLELTNTNSESNGVKTVSFVFDDESLTWNIVGLKNKPIPADNTKTILYSIITIEYFNRYKKGVDPRQLIVLSDYYRFALGQIDYAELDKTIEKDKDTDRDLAAIYSATNSNPSKDLDSDLTSLIRNRIRTDNYKILPLKVLEEKKIKKDDLNGNIAYEFKVEGFPFEPKLFLDNYLEVIRSMI